MRHIETHRSNRVRVATLTPVEIGIVVLVLCALIAAAIVAGSGGGPAATATRHVRVEAGDTLWSLALRHPVRGLSTAETVELIAELNDTHADALQADSTIAVPFDTDQTDSRLALR